MKLKELRELHPDIKATSVARFLEILEEQAEISKIEPSVQVDLEDMIQEVETEDILEELVNLDVDDIPLKDIISILKGSRNVRSKFLIHVKSSDEKPIIFKVIAEELAKVAGGVRMIAKTGAYDIHFGGVMYVKLTCPRRLEMHSKGRRYDYILRCE